MEKEDKERDVFLADPPRDQSVKNPWLWIVLLLIPILLGIVYSMAGASKTQDENAKAPVTQEAPIQNPRSPSGRRG